jgi:orotate phosphoribosyltransferase-like protein
MYVKENPTLIRQMKDLASEGKKQKEIATQLNVSPSTVARYTGKGKSEMVPEEYFFCNTCPITGSPLSDKPNPSSDNRTYRFII